MGPTLLAVKERWHPVQVAGAPFWTSEWDSKALAPYRQFCKNSEEKGSQLFSEFDKTNWPEDIKRKIKPDSLLILIPAFTVSQLTQAFRIGLLIYLPFLAIDLLISNILLAMGMMMVSPMTISLPFKLLIFYWQAVGI